MILSCDILGGGEVRNFEIRYSHCAERRIRSQKRKMDRVSERVQAIQEEPEYDYEEQDLTTPQPPPTTTPAPPPATTNPTEIMSCIPSNTGGCTPPAWGALRDPGTQVPGGTTLRNVEHSSGLKTADIPQPQPHPNHQQPLPTNHQQPPQPIKNHQVHSDQRQLSAINIYFNRRIVEK